MAGHVIGIGGTGAKCVEAITHFCAAGLLPAEEISVLLVDPDEANGSLGRTTDVLTHYNQCTKLRMGESDLFRTKLTPASERPWTPLPEAKVNDLDSVFGAQQMIAIQQEQPYARLYEVLYSPSERKQELKQGFRGHPSIGAAVFARNVDVKQPGAWQSFLTKLRNEAQGGTANVFLAGSVFGGTGAAGIPTIARLINNASKEQKPFKTRFGALLMLPYFVFDKPQGDGLNADSAQFLENTQTALGYYEEQASLELFQSLFLLGTETKSLVEPSVGGATQRNAPHVVELYAATVAKDFLGTANGNQPANGKGGQIARHFVIARNAKDSLAWSDLPSSTELQSKFRQLLRFAVSFDYLFYPMMEHIWEHPRSAYQAPWYIDFFKKDTELSSKTFAEIKKQVAPVKAYCDSLLLWWANLQNSASGTDLKIGLVNSMVYAKPQDGHELEKLTLKPPEEFDSAYFGHLLLPATDVGDSPLGEVWERVCNARPDKQAAGLGKFLGVLYSACAA